MKPIKTILCPTDFSECSRAAVDRAVDLAQRLGAQIRLLHVLQLPYYVGWEGGVTMAAATAAFLDDVRKKTAAELQAELARCTSAGVVAQTELVEGVPYAKIVEAAAGADLVVLGTHGRTGLSHLVLGSVAERVLRLAPCPVLSVPKASA